MSETEQSEQTESIESTEDLESTEQVEPTEATDQDEIDAAAEDEDEADSGEPGSLQEQLEREGDIAADYLEELLDIADLDGDLDMDVEGERAVVSIVGADLQQLVGDQGKVLDALQELARLAVMAETGERTRLMLDVAGYRDRRRKELLAIASDAVEDVKSTGEAVALTPMNPFERKVVHDAVAAAGLVSASEGEEPRRRVIVRPSA